MTRKDFEAIAEILAAERAVQQSIPAKVAVSGVAYSLADYFARANPRFDRQRFYVAAGVADSEV